ncbi:hypothetical protein [Xanthobacter sp.]|uniref:hypothetical protein n=1 Tax=Xanthobacter sp. TaxID=35809 RepID=UPI0035AF4295
MTQAGGPAAINGFLYQILHHLGWIAEVSLSGTLDGSLVTDARLVLEPRQGGDARAEAGGVYLVEQYKTREDGTWSVTDIVSVLGDLRKAVPHPHPALARYRFVTDGRPGRLEPLDTFLADVKSAATPDDLDRMEKRKFSAELVLTHGEFFDHVVAASRAAGEVAAPDERLTVFHLLRQLELGFGSRGDAQAAAVEKLLRRYAPNLGDERGIRERLVGVLVEKLSKGETQLDQEKIVAMFYEVGLNPERLFRLAQLAETMGERTRRRLARVGYRAGRDVRSPPDWPGNKPVLLIAGPSGTGKTWQLGRLLETLAQSRELATLVPSANTSETVLQDAARDIWQTGLGETSEKSLVAVAHFLRELVLHANARRITVAADDVQDIDVARSLVRQDWTEWGMRLVMTVPHDLARALQAADSDRIHLHPVGNFSTDELDRLLRQNGRSWAELPPDLKTLLRAPILAGLFLDLPYGSVQRAPRSEYEIFDAFWARIALKGRPGDQGIVLALAASYVDGQPYPLPRQRWGEIGLTDDIRARLDAAGWLRATERGEIAFAHDRLLNWAVAKFLVLQHQRGDLKVQGLGDILGNDHGGEGQAVWRRLGYVPMDAVWLLGEVEQNTEPLGAIVARMEDCREFGSYGEYLYTDLLPTLGQRAVPILLARLNTVISGGNGDYRVRLIGRAFAGLARQDHVELTQLVAELLRSTTRDRQSVAIAVLTVSPDAVFLDRLWEIHRGRVDALEDKAKGEQHEDHRASFAALRAGVAQNPQWLRQQILSADPQTEPVSELGYLLNGLEHAEAPAIWRETRDVLMAKVPASKPRSMLYCMARFGDREKMEFVTRHLSQPQDFASGAALYALSVLDPRAAIDRLMEVGDAERDLTRNQWLPGLLRAEPELTRQSILTLAGSKPKGRLIIETLFDARPDEMNEALLRFVLRALEQDLREGFDAAVAGDPIWLDHPLRFLGSITRPDLLAILEAEAGGELERMISAIGCSRLRVNSNLRDHVREGARHLLILIGGEGITTLLRQELESEHYWVRHGGLNWAFVRRDDGIIERLAAIARRPLPRDANGKLESEPYFEFNQAMSRLAALGVDATLVDILLESGVPEVPTDLASMRAHQGPMPNTLTERAAATLANEAATEIELRVALAVAWLSGNVDLVPNVRAVLRKADSASSVAGYARIALLALGDRSEEFARLVLQVARTKENAQWGLNALSSLGDRGRDLLLEWLQSPEAASRADHEALVIRALYAHPATRAQAVAAAVASCLRGHHFGDAPYDIAAEASDPALRDRILDKAFAARSFVVTEPLYAIKGLAKFDIARAVDAIALALQSHPKIERELCRLLVRLAPVAAPEKLIKAAVLIKRGSLRGAVGRALRRLDPAVVAPLLAERMRGTVLERKTAAELAGWVPAPAIADALAGLADHDSASEVRLAALMALECHRKEASLRALLDAFRTEGYEKRWSLLTAILEGADAHLLKDRDDPLWLGHVLTDELPAAFEKHANDVLRQRIQREK